jgi:hypothetical protein
MEEENPKKKRQKGDPTHKKNWREMSATPAEIKEFLS